MPEGESSRDVGVADDLRYSPGAGWLIRAGNVAVLLPGDADGMLLERLWAAAAAQPGLVEITAELVRHGLSALPDVAIAVLEGDSAHLVLRGRAIVRTTSAEHDAKGWATWRELSLPSEDLTIILSDVAGAAWLPLSAGIVSADGLTWTMTVLPEPDAASPDAGHEASTPPLTSSARSALAAPVETLREEDLRAVVTVPNSSDAASGASAVDVPVGEPAPAQTSGAVGGEPAVAPEIAPGVVPDDEDSYDRLFGATAYVARHKNDLAASGPTAPAGSPVREGPTPGIPAGPHDPGGQTSGDREPTPGELGRPAPPAAAGPVPLISSAPAPEPDREAAARPSAVAPPSGLIAAVPTWGASPPPPVSGASPAPAPAPPGHQAALSTSPSSLPDDVEGLTISRSDLRARRDSGPTVHGVRCPQGHANPPEVVVCRLCAMEIPAQAATTMPRPPLGALLLEGETAGAPDRILLDGTLIIGRRPSVDRVGDTVPRLVAIPSPDQDLSRNHARIAVEGWHVMVTDLGSTNGTVVTLPGEQPQRLHPDRPAMIIPGTRVTLAEVVTYRFEVQS